MKIAYQPGSTQEVVLRELMKASAMTANDVQLVRLSFGDMPNALARGDVDAYLGAEPGPSITSARMSPGSHHCWIGRLLARRIQLVVATVS